MTTAKKIAVTDETIPLKTRIRAVYKPGMSINDLAVKTRGKVDAIKKAVRKLRAEGFITEQVAHSKNGEALRAMHNGPTLTADQRAAFRRQVSDDMMAQIAAFPASKIKRIPPGGQETFFGQMLGFSAYPSMEA